MLIAKQMGLKSAIFTMRTPLTRRKSEVINDVDVFRFDSFFPFAQRLIRASPELVHGHSFGWIPATIAPWLVKRYVFTPHIYRLDVYPKWKVELALRPLRKSDIIITRTAFEASQFKRSINGPKICIVPLPIDYDFFAKREESWRTEILRRYGLNDSDRLILCVANLRPVKNLETLIRGFAVVKEEIPSARLVIVGGEPISNLNLLRPRRSKLNYRLELVKLANSLAVKNIKRDIIFAGYRDEIELRKFYAASEVFCMPSKMEGQLLAAGEAISAGLPLVLSNLPSLVEIYGLCALFHKPMDHKQLGANVIELFKNPELAGRLVSAGRSKMKGYRPTLIYTRIRAIYEDLLSGSR